jgi:Fe-Mn family superoxide dismutase
MPLLDYKYGDLEPHMDAQTLEIHYSKHHQTYMDKLNAALATHIELKQIDVFYLLKQVHSLPEEIQETVKNMGGGFLNHNLFWKMLAKPGQVMSEALTERLSNDFGSVQKFQDEFSAKAAGLFGSGWTWLIMNEDQKLEIVNSSNQENPAVERNVKILLGLDVWEHTYYLKYQNKRADFIAAWWNIVNWEYVDAKLAEILA